MPQSLSKREFIVRKKEKKPYGAKLEFELLSKLDVKGPCTLLIGDDIIVRLRPARVKDESDQQKRWHLEVEGFVTAGKAESTGLKITFGLLWWAISRKMSVRLIYNTPLPCQVFDRTQGGGGAISAFGITVTPGNAANRMVEEVEQALMTEIDPNSNLLVSMELFNAAAHETTERAKFVMMMSSVEPLIEQVDLTGNSDYGNALQDTVDGIKQLVKDAEDLPDSIRDSLLGQVSNLKRESIGQGLRRLCDEYLSDSKEAYKLLKECYNIRSQIVHEGGTDNYLTERTQELKEILRRLFSSITGMPLSSNP